MPGVGIKAHGSVPDGRMFTYTRNGLADLKRRLRLRVKRQRLMWRAIRSHRQLTSQTNRSTAIRPADILVFACVRNEADRLPYFLTHYRKMGVGHFLIVDNNSTDATVSLLQDAPDVSLWQTAHSYRAARFGMDWINFLLMRYGHGHWCLTVDADELLVLPSDDAAALPDLTKWLAARGAQGMAALMLDLYPKGAVSGATCPAGEDPTTVLNWYDAQGYSWERLPRYPHISIRGGPRKRVFFADAPARAPHMHKTPLIHWNWRYAYVSSTHLALPPRLNIGFDARENLPTGVLLHTKFLDQIIPKSREEKHRDEHFTHPDLYGHYYDSIAKDPVLWDGASVPLTGWRDMVAQGLMTPGAWHHD